MKNYIYIQAKADLSGTDPGAISFQHCFVEAENPDDAYLMGQRKVEYSEFLTSLKDSEIVNDYVIERPE